MDFLECSKLITETDVNMAVELGKMKESFDRIVLIIDAGSYKYYFLKRSILINIVDNETNVKETENSLNVVNTLEKLSVSEQEKFLEISFTGMLNIFNEEYNPKLFDLAIKIGRLEFQLNSYFGVVETSIDESLNGVLSAFIDGLLKVSLNESISILKNDLDKIGLPTETLNNLDINDYEQIRFYLTNLKGLIVDTCNRQVLKGIN